MHSQWRVIMPRCRQSDTYMTRIIQTQKIGTERKRLVRAIVISIRELSRQQGQSAETKDLIAFIYACLAAISKGIETTVAPWEKRDYWVKADRFRMEWDWTGPTSQQLKENLMADEWTKIPELLAKIGGKFINEKVSEKHRMGQPWHGAWDRLLASSPNSKE